MAFELTHTLTFKHRFTIGDKVYWLRRRGGDTYVTIHEAEVVDIGFKLKKGENVPDYQIEYVTDGEVMYGTPNPDNKYKAHASEGCLCATREEADAIVAALDRVFRG